MAPQKTIWCAAGIDLVVDLELESSTSSPQDLQYSDSAARYDNRICQKGNSVEESTTSLTASSKFSPRQTQESLFHGNDLSKQVVDFRGESASAEAHEGKQSGQLLSLASHLHIQESSHMPRHNPADLRTGELDDHRKYCKAGGTSGRDGNTSSGNTLAEGAATSRVDSREGLPSTEEEKVHLRASKLRHEIHDNKRSERNTENRPFWPDLAHEGKECQCLVCTDRVIGDGLRATCDESYLGMENRPCTCKNSDISYSPQSSYREHVDMDIDAAEDSQESKFQMETDEFEKESDQDAGTLEQLRRSACSDENLDSDCSKNPVSSSQLDVKCPGIEQFNLAEISAACQLVGISSRSGYRGHLEKPNCCALGLRGVSDLEWMSRTLLQLFSTIPDLDIDTYNLVQGSSLPRKAEEQWCSSESGTMKGSTTLDLPTGTSSTDTRQESPGFRTCEVDWKDRIVDDEVLDRPPWMREYRSLQEILQ